MDHPRFDYDTLLTRLGRLGANKVVDPTYGNRVDIDIEFGCAITVSPGDDDEPLYQVDISTWDQTGASDARPIGATDDVLRAVEYVREVYLAEEERLEREDAFWAEKEPGNA